MTNFQDGEIYFGARIGLAISHVNSDIAALDANTEKTGFAIGGIVGFPVSQAAPVGCEMGLSIVQEGGINYCNENKISSNMCYLEVPAAFKYLAQVSKEFSIQPLVGGYIALGLGGKTKHYDTRTTSGSFSNNTYGLLDAGFRFGCGFSYDMVYAELAYDLGIVNISHDAFDSAKNRSLQLNVGINF